MKVFPVGFVLLALIGCSALAADADVIQIAKFSSDSCTGTPFGFSYVGVADQCETINPSASIKYTCTGTEIYTTDDCTGDPTVTDFECVSDTIGFKKTRCVTVPDYQIGKLQLGESCSGEGEVSEIQEVIHFVVNVCQPTEDGSSSYLSLQEGDDIRVIYYSESDCFGPQVSKLIEVGTCAVVVDFPGLASGDVAVKITPAVNGATLGEVFFPVPESTPSPTAGDDDGNNNDGDGDGDDNEDGDGDPNKGSAQMRSTISIFAFAAFVSGVLAMVF